MIQRTRVWVLATILLGVTRLVSAEPVTVQSVRIKLIEKVDVPARLAGVVKEVLVKEGDMVDADALLARIEDDEAELSLQRKQLEFEVARKQTKNVYDLRSAEKAQRVAERVLERANQAVAQIANSVSSSELDRYQLEADQAQISADRARFELETARLTVAVRENDVASARIKLAWHRIEAPIRGYVVEIMRRRREWVQPGETVLRMIRVDRLRAEGFVRAADVKGELRNAPVTLSVEMPDKTRAGFRGQVVFVSLEINPVNGQQRIWAEIENPNLRLKPGLRASMTVRPR